MNNISILEKIKCNGCTSCYNICPCDAITMQKNSEGFLYPIIDKTKCNNCGLCIKACSVLSIKYQNNISPECFAFMANNDIRFNCTSGGAFPILAKYFLDNGGYVCGVVWKENLKVCHIVSSKVEDVEKMLGSKYIQSEIQNSYKEIKNILNNKNLVLFVGTPCQNSGLKNYLQKEYDNLFCVDIICHGVPSQKVFEKYINELIQNNEKWICTNFRDKCNGWNNNHICTTTTSDNKYSINRINDNFLKAFLNDLCLRESCGKCIHNNIPRQGDITIGDFWGINNFNEKYNDGLGTSVILLNNKKGEFLKNILQKDAKLFKKVPLKYAVAGNPALIKSTVHHKDRKLFFDKLDETSLSENNDIILNDKCDCMITNLWRTVNYGAVLTCLGVKCLCESFGLKTKVIDFVLENSNNHKYEDSFTENFAKKYLNLTKKCYTYEDLVNLNKYCKCFVSGSDQIFADWIMSDYHSKKSGQSYYLLNFVNSSAKKIAYAGSFGTNFCSGNFEYKTIFKHYISQFDGVSVREDSGKIIMQENFGVESTHLLDGAFHIPKDILEDLTLNFEKKEKYIAYFGLPKFNNENWQNQVLTQLSKKLNIPVKYMTFDRKISVEEWLAFIKNADFVVSNSYHMIVFSIIFNRPFLQIVQANNTQTRFDSLFKMLNITNKSLYKADLYNLDLDRFLKDFDWQSINNLIDKEINIAREWFKNTLNSKKYEDRSIDILNYMLNQQYFDKKKTKKDKLKLFMLETLQVDNYKKYKLKILGIKVSFKLKNFSIKINKT